MGLTAEEILEHHGIKGMKWGVRRADKKWEKKVMGEGGVSLKPHEYIELHNMAAEKANRIDIPRINNKPEYKKGNFTKDSPLRRKYYAEHETAFNNRMRQALFEKYGTSPSGMKKIQIKNGKASIVDVTHADDPLKVNLKLDETGHIVLFEIADDSLQQSSLADEILEHHGIKGMKWGVRKNRGSGDPGGVKGFQTKDKKGRTVSSDRKKVDALLSRKSTSLSNKQLQLVKQRMELEKNFNRVNPSKVKKGHDHVKEILAVTATVGSIYTLKNSEHGQAMMRAGAKLLGKEVKKAAEKAA